MLTTRGYCISTFIEEHATGPFKILLTKLLALVHIDIQIYFYGFLA
jgi:hypothetical protein